MPLASLYAVPQSREDWSSWSFANADSHLRIIQAIRQQKSTFLNYYTVDPIPWGSLSDWLRNHYQMHSDMDGVLDIISSDLSTPNFHDPEEMLAFILSHADEHKSAEQQLGLEG